MRSISKWENLFSPSEFLRGDIWSEFSEVFSGLISGVPAEVLDVTETDEHYKIIANAPGFEKEQLKVVLEHGMLTVSGEISDDSEETYLYRTSRTKFSDSFFVGYSVNSEDVEATYKNGQLIVMVPKSDKGVMSHTIEIS